MTNEQAPLSEAELAYQRGMSAYQPTVEQWSSMLSGARDINTEAYRTEQAVLAERERCAKVAESFDPLDEDGIRREVAAAIRSGK